MSSNKKRINDDIIEIIEQPTPIANLPIATSSQPRKDENELIKYYWHTLDPLRFPFVSVPCLYRRDNIKYLNVRIMELEILNEFEHMNSTEVARAGPLVAWPCTQAEIELLNEISINYLKYGIRFKQAQDTLVSLVDFLKFYDALARTCPVKANSKHFISQLPRIPPKEESVNQVENEQNKSMAIEQSKSPIYKSSFRSPPHLERPNTQKTEEKGLREELEDVLKSRSIGPYSSSLSRINDKYINSNSPTKKAAGSPRSVSTLSNPHKSQKLKSHRCSSDDSLPETRVQSEIEEDDEIIISPSKRINRIVSSISSSGSFYSAKEEPEKECIVKSYLSIKCEDKRGKYPYNLNENNDNEYSSSCSENDSNLSPSKPKSNSEIIKFNNKTTNESALYQFGITKQARVIIKRLTREKIKTFYL